MNYLKAFANINDARDIVKSEQQYRKAKSDAIRIVKRLAEDMYNIEMNRTQYELWDAIRSICNSLEWQE